MLFRRYELIVASLFFVTALVWSRHIPLFEAPDEYSHYKYVEFIADHGRLPQQSDVVTPDLWESFQPPLYYVCVASLVRLGWCETGATGIYAASEVVNGDDVISKLDHNAMAAVNTVSQSEGVLRMRSLNSLFGALLLLAGFWLMRESGAEGSGSFLVVIWGFLPAVAFSAGTMTNDILAALLSVSGLAAYQRYRFTNSIKMLLLSGVFFGFGVMTKSTVLFLWTTLMAFEWFRSPRFYPTLSRVLLTLVPLAIGAPSIIRSLSMHPMTAPDPLRLQWIQSSPIWAFASWPLTLIKSIYWSIPTAVGVLGAQTIWLPAWVYGLYSGLLFVALRWAWQCRKPKLVQFSKWVTSETVVAASLFATLLLFALTMVRFRESGESMHSRLLLGYIPGMLCGLAIWLKGFDFQKVGFRRTKSTQFLVVGTALAVGAVGASKTIVWQIAESFRSGLHLRNSTLHYAEVLSRGIIAFVSIVVLLVVAPHVYKFFETRIVRRETLIVLLAIAGSCLSVALLYFVVIPAFAGRPA